MTADFQSVFFLQISDAANRSSPCAIAQPLHDVGCSPPSITGVSPLVSNPSELYLVSHCPCEQVGSTFAISFSPLQHFNLGTDAYGRGVGRRSHNLPDS